MKVYMGGSKEFLGGINQNCSCDAPQFTIIDPLGKTIMKIEGPSCGACCPCPLFGDIAFQIFDMNRNPAGTILKRFTIKEVVSDANDFGLLIPPEMDPRLKAVLLGAVFSIVRRGRMVDFFSYVFCAWLFHGSRTTHFSKRRLGRVEVNMRIRTWTTVPAVEASL